MRTLPSFVRFALPAWVWLGSLCAASLLAAPYPAEPQRLRVLIETDAGGDPDDEQSLVRFLLYANEWDVEGLIANRPVARERENLNPQRTGLGIVKALIDGYAAVHPQLIQHDARYPEPAQLRSVLVPGYNDVEDGVNRILQIVDRADPRPVWYADWGSDNGAGTNNLRRALDRVLKERGERGYADFKSRLRVVGHDVFGPHTRREPLFKLWLNPYEPTLQGQRWYHRFSALTATAGGFDAVRDLLHGHGALGALYPTNTTHWMKEGDTPTFLYWFPTGLGDPEHPTWGGWPGRYGRNPQFGDAPYYWANQQDAWGGTTNRDNTLRRWAVAIQNDFRTRLNWCVQPRRGANHPPEPQVNGVPGTSILHLTAEPGEWVPLSTEGSVDPDGDPLSWEAFVYTEAGDYPGTMALEETPAGQKGLRLPADSAGRTLHLVLACTDSGEPRLTRYRRVIVTVRDARTVARRIEPYSQVPSKLEGRSDGRRSPLQPPDGPRITTPEGWKQRRDALRREWMELMGPWPPLVEKPRVETLTEFRRDGFRQRRVRVQTAVDQTSEGWWLEPEGKGPFPAVLVVYYEPETSVGMNPRQTFRDYGLQLARRGFVTLSIGTPGGNAFNPDTRAALCQPLSYHAYVAANAWRALADNPRVDPARIGVVGHSYGGKWALFAAALWEPFACVAVSDPGIVFDESRSNINYWEPWYLGADPNAKRKPGIPTADNPRTGAYARMIELGRDLHELHALMAPRPFLVSGGAEDPPERWQTLQHLKEVNQVLGKSPRVWMTNRERHDPDDVSNAVLYDFFEASLRYGLRD